MAEIITLQLSYGIIRIFNLQKTWIQRMVMRPGYMLCYEDDKYERGVIYRSTDFQLLFDFQNDLYNSLDEGKKNIKLK